jgi:4-amino-4-deoxy-L-arabinose transferase-like glycosyltransferase
MVSDTAQVDSPLSMSRPFRLPMERIAVCGAVLLTLVLGLSNLGAPSFWHDELVFVYTAGQVLEQGAPYLPSGAFYPSGLVYSYLLAGWMAVFGDSEAATRAPSVFFAACNVVLLYALLRPLFGAPTALAAAFALALSPWSVAWSREARLYALQQTLYLLLLWGFWKWSELKDRKQLVTVGIGLIVLYALAIGTAIHSILFLGPLGLYSCLSWSRERRWRSRWTVAVAVISVVGLTTIAGYLTSLPQADQDAIIKEAGLGGVTNAAIDRDRADSLFYFRFLTNNLSTGFFVLALIGSAWICAREGKRGLYICLAFWVPVLMLNYLIGYRRFRFMYFAFPFYVALFAYALIRLAAFVATARQAHWRMAATVLIVLFGTRLAHSQVLLLGDTLEAASGSDTTLARRHPQWREPCAYVRARADDAVVVSTTYLAARYYVGRCDNWFPNRSIVWEAYESGIEGLANAEAFAAYVDENPRGYFLAERRRFQHWNFFADDLAWVEANMIRIDDASNEDVTVYAWGLSE